MFCPAPSDWHGLKENEARSARLGIYSLTVAAVIVWEYLEAGGGEKNKIFWFWDALGRHPASYLLSCLF